MRALAVLVCALLMAAGCATNLEDENAKLANAMFDAFNKHDWRRLSSFYSAEARFLDPSFGKTYVTQTRDQIAAKYAAMEKLFPDIHDQVIGVYASGDKVTVEFISTAQVSDSVQFSLPIVSILTFKDGLIVQDATYYDQENP